MAITFSCDVSRTSGVAPLAVFIDCTGTTATGVTYPFHELFYEHSFGDSEAGHWLYGAQAGTASKNYATGACAAHVFETPGTYTITSRCWDGSTYAYEQNTITVTDPNTVFSGTNTICVNASGSDWTGAPAGALLVTQSNFATIISTYANTGKRVLLKRGDSFTLTAMTTIVNQGPMLIGAFGSGAKPYIYTTSDIKMLDFGAGNMTLNDVRLMDLHFDGGNTGNSVGPGLHENNGAGVSNLLLFRIDLSNFQTSFGFGDELPNQNNNAHGWTNKNDVIAFVECTSTPSSNTSYVGYNAGNRFIVLGNHLDDGANLEVNGGSHLFRFPFLKLAVISHNDLYDPGGSRHNIYILGPIWTGGAPDPVIYGGTVYSVAENGDGISEYIIISDNHLKDSSPDNSRAQIIFTPINPADSRIKNVILERNLHEFTVYSYVAQEFRASHITSRNNLAISHTANGNMTLVFIPPPEGNPATNHIWIYNNTLYRSTAGGDGNLFFLDMQDANISDVILKNNLIYAPNSANSNLYRDPGITNFTHSNNSGEGGININSTNPGFVDPTGLELKGFRTTNTASYPATGGTAQFPAINRDAFNGSDKTGAIRMGALVPKANARCSGAK